MPKHIASKSSYIVLKLAQFNLLQNNVVLVFCQHFCKMHMNKLVDPNPGRCSPFCLEEGSSLIRLMEGASLTYHRFYKC